MLINALNALKKQIPIPFETMDVAVNCHHNYISREHHFGKDCYVTRKGAVRARKDELGIIPWQHGRPFIHVRGLGNPESFESCSHGAGRVMSRTKAKQIYNVADQIAATEGVECRKDKSVIDGNSACLQGYRQGHGSPKGPGGRGSYP